MSSTDLLIVGAGLAGLPIAIACAQAGWQVTIIDHNPSLDTTPTDPLDQRCTAIGSASEGLLRRWGVWDAIVEDAQNIQQVQITQKGYLGRVRLLASELGVNALGHVIENRTWVDALSKRAQQNPSIRLLRGETLVSVRDNASAAAALTVELTSGATVQAKLIIATDGVHSRVRDLVGIGDAHVDYEQSALMTTVQVSKPHQNTAYERFTACGPLALLPRPNNMMSLVWCLAPSEASQWGKATDALVIEQLQSLFGFKLGRIQALGPRTVVPLIRREALKQVGKRTVLLGNAARLLHPVAGQGFNLALRDAACLLDFIGQRTMDKSSDPGDEHLLSEFCAARASDQKRVVSLTDSLAKGFLGHASLPAYGRGFALMGLDSVAPLRRAFANRTMGYTG